MTKASGVELKGRMVKVRGSAVGSVPPENETLKGPHWLTREYETNWKSEKALRGAKTRKQRSPGRERSMAKQVESEAGWDEPRGDVKLREGKREEMETTEGDDSSCIKYGVHRFVNLTWICGRDR